MTWEELGALCPSPAPEKCNLSHSSTWVLGSLFPFYFELPCWRSALGALPRFSLQARRTWRNQGYNDPGLKPQCLASVAGPLYGASLPPRVLSVEACVRAWGWDQRGLGAWEEREEAMGLAMLLTHSAARWLQAGNKNGAQLWLLFPASLNRVAERI